MVVRKARRFNSYSGYSQDFKFRGNYTGEESSEQSVIIAVDALDFSKGLLSKSSQYSKRFLRRELHKFYVGIEHVVSSPEYWVP